LGLVEFQRHDQDNRKKHLTSDKVILMMSLYYDRSPSVVKASAVCADYVILWGFDTSRVFGR